MRRSLLIIVVFESRLTVMLNGRLGTLLPSKHASMATIAAKATKLKARASSSHNHPSVELSKFDLKFCLVSSES
jgi:hypothetical protein